MRSRFSATRERVLRALAYDVVCRRDRCGGWKPHREAFLLDAGASGQEVAARAVERLSAIIQHAYQTSPYYRHVWEATGFHPSSFAGLADLQRLPFLTKDIIKSSKHALVSTGFGEYELDLDYTGGTTGTQTSFYRDHACTVARFGRQWGILDRCGYRPGMRRGLVWGVHDDLPAAGLRGSLKRWFRCYATSQETLCCTVMSDTMIQEFYGRLRRFRPEVLYGYPSALAQFGRYIQAHDLESIRVRSIITTAERLSEVAREELGRLFGGEVFNLYCTREYGCVGFECAEHQGFHIDSGSVFVEIVDNGRPVQPGGAGEIVITDLLNYGMPFIRSRTGDIGALADEPCRCGSALPLIKSLDGRSSDLLYRPDGAVIPGLMLTDLFIDMPSIRYLQFRQEQVDRINVVLVVTPDFNALIQTEVERQVRTIMGNEISIQVRLVDEIERSPRSGKVREIVCTVGQANGTMRSRT